MKINFLKMTMKHARDILIAFAVVAVVAYVAVFEGGISSSSFTADSVRYLRMAENIKAGYLMNQDGLAGGKSWFAIWPIGYPALVAATSAVTRLDVFWASKTVNVLCAIILLVLFWKRGRTAFPLLALSILNLAYLKVSRSTLSEPVFMVLMVAMCFAVEDMVVEPKASGLEWRSVALLFSLFVAVFLVRYVGFFAPLWVGMAIVLCRGGLSALKTVAFAGGLAWVFDGAYWAMNKAMCGFVSGYGRAAPKETSGELVRMVLGAEVHELQAWGVLAFFGACLWFLSLRFSEGRCKILWNKFGKGRFFVVIGLLYHVTLVFMRCRQNFDVLGFRLLYPGTFLMTIGVTLGVTGWNNDWSAMVNRIPTKFFASFLLGVMILGSWMLHGELQLRRALGISVYELASPYLELKKQIVAEYANVPRGTRLNIGCSCCDAKYLLAAFRPDLIVKTSEK